MARNCTTLSGCMRPVKGPSSGWLNVKVLVSVLVDDMSGVRSSVAMRLVFVLVEFSVNCFSSERQPHILLQLDLCLPTMGIRRRAYTFQIQR